MSLYQLDDGVEKSDQVHKKQKSESCTEKNGDGMVSNEDLLVTSFFSPIVEGC